MFAFLLDTEIEKITFAYRDFDFQLIFKSLDFKVYEIEAWKQLK